MGYRDVFVFPEASPLLRPRSNQRVNIKTPFPYWI